MISCSAAKAPCLDVLDIGAHSSDAGVGASTPNLKHRVLLNGVHSVRVRLIYFDYFIALD